MSLQEIVRLDWLPRVLERINADPVNILSWYDGIAPPIHVLKDLGVMTDIQEAEETET